jgi:VWFA-related protein
MSFYQRTAIILTCTLAFASAAQLPQKGSNPQDAVIRINVDLVQVDAVVTNSKDEPVTDLKAEDFIILQDDRIQEITNFSFVRTREPGQRVRPAKTAASAKDTPAPPPPPPGQLRREKVRRTYALVVDDLGLSFDSTVRVRQAIRKWLDEEMQPDDLVAVMLTGGGVGALQQFTNDKRLLYAAADRININAASRVGTSSFEAIGTISGLAKGGSKDAYGMTQGMPKEEHDLQFTLFSLGSIQHVINGLNVLPGRKNLILFSEDMRIMFGGGVGQSQGRDIALKEKMRVLIDAANRASVVIHAIDPRGVVYTGLTAEDNASGLDAEAMGNVMGQRTQQLIETQDAMVSMTKQTGGLFVANRNDIGRALEAVADDGDGYYLIGYQPDESTASELRRGKGKLHRVQVRVKRPGLRVRSRSEFYSTPDKINVPDFMSRPQQVEQALHSPFAGGTLRVRLTALFSQTKDEKPFINTMLHFDANQLAFSDEPEGWHKAVIEITAGLFGSDGKQTDFADKTWNIMAKGATYENMQKNGVSFFMRVPVKQPGAYQMRLVLRDTRTGQLGNATQIIEVPNIREGRLALSGLLLVAEQQKPKAIENQPEGVIETADTNGTAAVRMFQPDATISWIYQVLNAKTDSNRKPQLQAQIRLFQDGKEIYARKPASMTAEPQGDSKRMIASDQMHLNKLAPGNYILQVAVSDMLATDRQRMAVQSIDFDIQNQEQK